jgi:integrase
MKRVHGVDYGGHDLRRIYAHIAYAQYGADNQALQSFIMENLGHDELETSLNYSNVKLKGSIKKIKS